MRSLRIRLVGKQDRNKNDYYFTTTHVPATIDLNNSVIHFYPDEEEDGTGFGGELVVRHYDPRAKDTYSSKLVRKRKRRMKTEEQDAIDSDNTIEE